MVTRGDCLLSFHGLCRQPVLLSYVHQGPQILFHRAAPHHSACISPQGSSFPGEGLDVCPCWILWFLLDNPLRYYYYYYLSLTIQTIFYLSSYPLIQTVVSHLGCKNTVRQGVKSFSKVKMLPLHPQIHTFVIEGKSDCHIRLVKQLANSCWLLQLSPGILGRSTIQSLGMVVFLSGHQHTCECFCSVFTFSFQHLENIKNAKEQFAAGGNVNCSWSFLLTVLLAT